MYLIQFNQMNFILRKMNIENLDILFVKLQVMAIDMDIMIMNITKY